MLDLAIVRHGESVRNHASDLAHRGQTTLLEHQLRFDREESSWDLTQLGIEQAKSAGTWIRENLSAQFDAKYVSPFKRSRQTAMNLGLHPDHWHVDARLRERDWGVYWATGLPVYTVAQYLQDLGKCGEIRWKGEFPGAESVLDMVPRCRAFLTDLFSTISEGKVILVTHGGTMKTLQLILESLGPEDEEKLRARHLTNCSVLHYRLESMDAFQTWIGQVRFASPSLPGCPESSWEPVRGSAQNGPS